MVNICPVCGYHLNRPPEDFTICPSCGTEFGYDDSGRTYAQLRAIWLRGGAKWWSKSTSAPEGWDPYLQLDDLVNRPTPFDYAVLNVPHQESVTSALCDVGLGQIPPANSPLYSSTNGNDLPVKLVA